MNLTETNCTFEFQGQKFTAGGADVTPEHATVYVKADAHAGCCVVAGTPIKVSSWHGAALGSGRVVSTWFRWTPVLGRSRWVAVRFTIDGVTYAGRLNWDNGELVRGRAVKGGR